MGTPYTGTVSATGGSAPYAFTLASGSLPDGLSLSSAGAISGTPKSAGSFPITIKVTDSATTSVSGTYTITVTDPDGSGGSGGSGPGGGSSSGWSAVPRPRSQPMPPPTTVASIVHVACGATGSCVAVGYYAGPQPPAGPG